jgi:hypothetical protein
MCLATSTPAVLPSVGRKTSAPRTCLTPLNTSPAPSPVNASPLPSRAAPCITRGRCGSLLLHRDGLPPSTSCRSPGAPVHIIIARSQRTSLDARFSTGYGDEAIHDRKGQRLWIASAHARNCLLGFRYKRLSPKKGIRRFGRPPESARGKIGRLAIGRDARRHLGRLPALLERLMS